MKKSKIISMAVITAIVFQSFYIINIGINPAFAANEIKDIEYKMIKESDDYEYGGYLFSNKPELDVQEISIKAPAGKVIKKLDWVNAQTGVPLRSVEGFTPGKTTWKLKDRIGGTKIKVTSKENSNYGSIYYWDRWSISSTENWFGEYWRAGRGDVSVKNSKDYPEFCSPNVSTENKNPLTGQSYQGNNLPKYPGCTDKLLEAEIPRTRPFKINEPSNKLDGVWIKDGALSKQYVTASNIVIDRLSVISDLHGGTGHTDPSTVGGEVAKVGKDLNEITITFEQTFNNDNYRQYWAAPGAKQVWYFSKFFVDFDTITYMYQDKVLRATFSDGAGGLEITGALCVPPSGTTQLKVTLTKNDGSKHDLQQHSKLTWKSSNDSIAKVDSSGLVTVVASHGEAVITAHFKDGSQNLDETDVATIQVGTGAACTAPGDGDTGGDGGSCTIQIGAPIKGKVTSHSVMNPIATGMIKADERNSEKFNVRDGIPTSESLYVNVFGLNYLFQNKWANMTGEVTYTVPVTKKYLLRWTIPGVPATKNSPGIPDRPMQREKVVTKKVTIKRPYAYWQIDNLEVYKLTKSSVNNYALPNGSVTINPTGYTAPTLISTNSDDVKDHVKAFDCKGQDLGTQVVSGGTSEPSVPLEDSLFKTTAESHVGANKVRNDHVVFNGNTIMNNSWVDRIAPDPGIIPSPMTVSRDVLYGDNYLISNTLVNKANTSSAGTIYYDLIPNSIKGGSNKTYPVNGLNTVTVHTPVVTYGAVSDDKAHNQKTNPNPNRGAFILDRPFTVWLPTSGQHVQYLGYGNRNYAKYIRTREVWFPFDTYNADGTIFYPKQTWIPFPANQEQLNFNLPVWVDEGDYNVHFRTVAHNAPADYTHQPDANSNLNNHASTDTVPVEVIGRVYDFRITDIVDMNWELAFRQKKGSKVHTNNYYWSGTRGIDGQKRTIDNRFTLPIRRGSHPNPGHKNVTVKPGYHFKFDLKTKGNLFGPQDAIRITPTFEFISRSGKKRQSVDLYYHAEDRNFVRIGSSFDKVKIGVVLNARLRNLPEQQIEDTGRVYYRMHQQQIQMSEQSFMKEWLKQANRSTNIGSFTDVSLPGELRLYRGPTQLPQGVDPYRAYAAEQQWYGEFGIPSKVYVVPQGFELHRQFNFGDDAEFFLKDGYIVVNFNMETIRAGDERNPHLQYIHAPLTNQWKREGFSYQVTDPYGATFQLKDGDIIFYNADQSSRDDYRVGGTH